MNISLEVLSFVAAELKQANMPDTSARGTEAGESSFIEHITGFTVIYM